jgi:hypothetical protein
MEGLAYISGFRPKDPGPLSRFLPPLEEGTAGSWLLERVPPGSWVLDPFGFSPRVAVEAARSGYRVLVTANNPITRFLLELAAQPPSEADFKASLADLAASKRGEERLETHLRALYLTRCEQCGQENEAEAFFWHKGEDAPYARLYHCTECGDRGERAATQEDIDRARRIGAADAMHRSRALERVVAMDDIDRSHVEEALRQYLPRPLYVLASIINRLEAIELSAERRRGLTALVLAACDAGNSLWSLEGERPRPKQLLTSDSFRENNVWQALDHARDFWPDVEAPIPYVLWPAKIPGNAGICIYEGRLRRLAEEVHSQIPIAAVIGAVPRPNQAFWTLSALWAGWLWGRAAVEPYKAALRRRRYDWAWNATALNAAFRQLFGLVGLGTPFLGLLPEVEPLFLTSAFTAISAAGFDPKGIALRTADDPVQFIWERGERLKREPGQARTRELQRAMREHLRQRGEPVGYLHLHTAGLEVLTESRALRGDDQSFEDALRATNLSIQESLAQEDGLIHHTTGESVEAGLWALRHSQGLESLTDRAEVTAVRFLQKHPDTMFRDVETDLCRQMRGLLTPSQGITYAILESYANRDGRRWKLRPEDTAARRQEDLKTISALVEAVGKKLDYAVVQRDGWILWQQGGKAQLVFAVLVSGLVARVMAQNPHPAEQSVLVIPGGRAGLTAYKAQRDPDFAARLSEYRITKFRLWRSLAEMKILTRNTFEEQLASDPPERASGQLMMF